MSTPKNKDHVEIEQEWLTLICEALGKKLETVALQRLAARLAKLEMSN